MRQVLFWIPIKTEWTPDGIPIYGFGLMLFIAFVACTWLAGRLARKEGIAKEHIQDLAIWIFVGGIVGARIVFMIQYKIPPEQFFRIWEGGLVFYGSALGGVVGYFLAYFFILRRHGISSWKIADVAAPAAALGLALGRVGCLLNGCCYGDVACADCPHLHFPILSPPWHKLVSEGYQTAAGFAMQNPVGGPAVVGAVEPDSAAAAAGLRRGDEIVRVNGLPVKEYYDLATGIVQARGRPELSLVVLRDGQEVELPPFRPRTLGLHPTQLYETISMVLLLFLLLAFYPFKRHDGEVMVVFMLCYSAHRFINEMLRNDTDPVAFGMTLSMNGSILIFAAGLALGLYLWRKPIPHRPVPA